MTEHPPKFTHLLVTVLLYMVLAPFVPAGGIANTVLAIAFLVVLAVSVFDLGLQPRLIVLVVALLLIPAIIAKLNALGDQQIIDALYEASQAGVEIQLIICGLCYVVAFVAQSVRPESESALPAWIPIFLFATIAVVMIDRIRT